MQEQNSPEIQAREIELVNTSELIPYAKNANQHPPEQIDRLVKLIKYQGFRNPLVVQKGTNQIIAGNGRWQAAKKMGLEKVPVTYQEFENEAQLYAYMVSDNAIAEWAELDLSAINNEMLDFGPDFDVEHLGLEDFTIELPMELAPGDPDEVPEALPDPKVVRGEVYILGNHRLMCGDSTDIDDIERLFDGATAEICFTSPPYADQREYNGGKDLSTQHLATFIRTAQSKVTFFAVNLGYARKDGEVNPYWDDYITEAKNCGLKFLSWNIWDKGQAGSIGNQTAMFAVSHEWVFVFGPAHKDLIRTVPNKSAGSRSVGTIRNADGSFSKSKSVTIGEFSQMKTVLTMFPLQARNHGLNHPAMFPVDFPKAYIEAMTKKRHVVFEPFGGSGTTLIACEDTGRLCRIMEIDPSYAGMILDRWQKFTGKKAKREDGKLWDEIKAGEA